MCIRYCIQYSMNHSYLPTYLHTYSYLLTYLHSYLFIIDLQYTGTIHDYFKQIIVIIITIALSQFSLDNKIQFNSLYIPVCVCMTTFDVNVL